MRLLTFGFGPTFSSPTTTVKTLHARLREDTDDKSGRDIRILCNECLCHVYSRVGFICNAQNNLEKRIILPKCRFKTLLYLWIKTFEWAENGDAPWLLGGGEEGEAIAARGGIAGIDGDRADQADGPDDGVEDECRRGGDDGEQIEQCHGDGDAGGEMGLRVEMHRKGAVRIMCRS